MHTIYSIKTLPDGFTYRSNVYTTEVGETFRDGFLLDNLKKINPNCFFNLLLSPNTKMLSVIVSINNDKF